MAWTGGADELEDSPVVHMDKEDVAEVEKVLETFNSQSRRASHGPRLSY